MPRIHEMLESKFLKKEDVGTGVLLTVAGVSQKNVAKEGAEQEMKWCLEFEDSEKPLVLNSTNIQLCQKVFGSDDTDDWVGKRIVLFTDPNVSYQGKLIGGIRVRAPKKTTPPPAVKPKPVPVQQDEIDDSDIPFAWLLPLLVPTLLGVSLLC